MEKILGIRREDKNLWERRVPLLPKHVEELKEKYNIKTILQPFERRAITQEEYLAAGAEYDENLEKCSTILAVKEIPLDILMADKTYLFFSHTIKGQAYNMPLLKKLMDLKCTLIDYECIKDEKGRRLVFFGRYAGLAGMIDALHGYGQRLLAKGYETPFLQIKPAYKYKDLDEAKREVKKVGEDLAINNGLPKNKIPLVFGFTGYGNVSRGAQEIFDLMPHVEITPDELETLKEKPDNKLYKVVFKEEHMVEPKDKNDKFELLDYFNHPEKYVSKFSNYIPHLSVIINAIFWNEQYPRFITKKDMKEMNEMKLDLVCDISCDINGAVEFTEKATESDNPAYVYNPFTDQITDGYEGEGIVNIAVDNLPTELPRDASGEFGEALFPFIPGIVNAKMNGSFETCELPAPIKRAVILYKGELTPDYQYLKEYLK